MKSKTKPTPFIVVVATIAVTSSISMLGGVSIELVAEKLIPIIPLLIALPSLSTMVGDYATVVSSYEQDGLEGKREQTLYKAISKSMAVNISGLILLSLLLAIRRGYQIDMSFVVEYSLFILCSIIFTVIAVFLISNIVNSMLRNRNMNAEDILIPVISSVTNALMLILVSISVLTIF